MRNKDIDGSLFPTPPAAVLTNPPDMFIDDGSRDFLRKRQRLMAAFTIGVAVSLASAAHTSEKNR